MIRVAVTFNRTHYFIDHGQERGVTYESLRLFEKDLNDDLNTGKLKVNVVIVPLSRDQLYPALVNGTVDMVAAMVTVTPEREKLVAFSLPTRRDVDEVVVTGPGRRRSRRSTISPGRKSSSARAASTKNRWSASTSSWPRAARRRSSSCPRRKCSKTMTCSKW